MLTRFCTLPKLELAWRRINTSTSASYKQYFRIIYEAYELNATENLRILRDKIRDSTYQPSNACRFYYPKPSGLQRPVTLLCVEDQIVFQAISNLFVDRLGPRRRPLERKYVFSNILQSPQSIFLYEDWRDGYDNLSKKLVGYYKSGNKWLASFDLAAFFDTISHELIVKVLFPNNGYDTFRRFIKDCLQSWSSTSVSGQYSHGIPQGPVASSFIAECILLKIDIDMSKRYKYARYVDDIRLMAKDENELRCAIVDLDKNCRDIGLIPNTDKAAMGKLPNMKELQEQLLTLERYSITWSSGYHSEEYSKKLVIQSLSSNRRNIEDRTKFRFAFFRASKSRYLLRTALRLWKRYPENTDAIVEFFKNYQRSKPILDYCTKYIRSNPAYDYVCGEMWKLVARLASPQEMLPLIQLAIDTVRQPKSRPYSSVCANIFLSTAQSRGLGNYARWAKFVSDPIKQALLCPYLPLGDPAIDGVVKQCLDRTIPDPGISLTKGFMIYNRSPNQIAGQNFSYNSVVEGIYQKVGLIPQTGTRLPNPISTFLSRRYDLPSWNGWLNFFGPEYQHAHMLLVMAETYLQSYRSAWVEQQDSFNDLLIRRFQDVLASTNSPGHVFTIHQDGSLRDYGSILNDNRFDSVYPAIALNLRTVHVRRRTSPGSHPKEKRTHAKAKPLGKHEQTRLVNCLKIAYSSIMNESIRLGIQ